MSEIPRDLVPCMKAAEILGVSDQTVRNQIRSGNLRGYLLGGRILVHPDDLASFIKPMGPQTKARGCDGVK